MKKPYVHICEAHQGVAYCRAVNTKRELENFQTAVQEKVTELVTSPWPLGFTFVNIWGLIPSNYLAKRISYEVTWRVSEFLKLSSFRGKILCQRM